MKNKYRILVVDDDKNTRNGLSKILTSCNYEVVDTENGDEALEIFKRTPFDLLITDKMMPGMDGIELLKKIRIIAPEVGVIILTARGEVDSYLDAMSLGAVEYLNKPINVKQLKSIISNHLSK